MCSHARIIVPIFINGTPQWVRDVPFIILKGGIEISSLFQHQLNGWWSFSSTHFFLFAVFFPQTACQLLVFYHLWVLRKISKLFLCPSVPLVIILVRSNLLSFLHMQQSSDKLTHNYYYAQPYTVTLYYKMDKHYFCGKRNICHDLLIKRD